MDQWTGVIFAAGKSTRMKSNIPKMLHPVCGKELIRYPVENLQKLGVKRILVVTSPSNNQAIRRLLGDQAEYIIQPTALGTGDALRRAFAVLRGKVEHIVVQYSDIPLIKSETLQILMARHITHSNDITLSTYRSPAAQDLGTVLRDANEQLISIVEASEWPDDKEKPNEKNTGIYCFAASWLEENVDHINASPKSEIYLTSLIEFAAAHGANIEGVIGDNPDEHMGVNDRLQLALVEARERQRIREQWMLAGVTIIDPASVLIDAEVTIGHDTVIWPNTLLVGHSRLGNDCQIGPSTVIRDSEVGHRCRITISVLEEATLDNDVEIGPFSHLRHGTHLESWVHIGNFAEIKNSHIATGTEMGHFGYVGDASIGAKTNLGAGLVTCNYDGKEKHRTVVEAGAFIGSDTMLVAPITIGAEAVTGAGSVVTDDVPPGRLVVGVPAKILRKVPKAN